MEEQQVCLKQIENQYDVYFVHLFVYLPVIGELDFSLCTNRE